eukprot:Phypoly_transcript_05610.p1 GENE.Phypoly_transcript_05610~~Phypoly_transcript_05610.p1  ORF type:complete len:407 (+),score=51.94 Phypoly_transcript_05610:98-1318(+)
MEQVVHRCRTFSIIANLNKLESFILHDPTAQGLYQHYLSLSYPGERKANHVPFFVDIVELGEKGNCSKANANLRGQLYLVFEKHFADNSPLLLDIPNDRLEQVRRNIQRDLTLAAFKPAIKAVVRDLAFIYMEGFINSPIFRDFKETLVDVDFGHISKATVHEKDSTHKLRKFFGEKLLHTGSSFKLMGDQPNHIKEYKLSKIFGERVGVEKTALLGEHRVDVDLVEAKMKRRDRRLHAFFGDNFEVEEELFSARVQVPTTECCAKEFPKQPDHVNTFRLTKFFGERPPTNEAMFQFDFEESDCDDGDGVSSANGEDIVVAKRMHSQSQHLMRFFGERMDPAKEAHSVAFAYQPDHVKPCTLKKIFGESAAHTINFEVDPIGGTWPKAKSLKSRAKMEKFFGPFEG